MKVKCIIWIILTKPNPEINKESDNDKIVPKCFLNLTNEIFRWLKLSKKRNLPVIPSILIVTVNYNHHALTLFTEILKLCLLLFTSGSSEQKNLYSFSVIIYMQI